MYKTLLAIGAIVLFASPAVAEYREVTTADRQMSACFGDVMRLCAQFVPNMDATKECMRTKRDIVSAPCAAFYPK